MKILFNKRPDQVLGPLTVPEDPRIFEDAEVTMVSDEEIFQDADEGPPTTKTIKTKTIKTSQQSPQQVISKFTRDFIHSKGWKHKDELDDWCIRRGSQKRKNGIVPKNPLYEKVEKDRPVQWDECVSSKTGKNYSRSSVRYTYQQLLQGYAYNA